MRATTQVSFGDNVRVLDAPETRAQGVAGLIGNVHGHTTPSITGVEVIGSCSNDHALNVFFEERQQGFWFAPELLEFLDHAAGSEITLDGVSKKWVRSDTGEWIEHDFAEPEKRKRWWKLW